MSGTIATVERTFVGLPSPIVGRAGAGGHPCQGIYHTPAGRRPPTAFIATHYNVDFSEHYLGEHLAARGYGFLGWNTRFRGAEAHFLLDHTLAEIGVGVRWLREHGVERIVLLGNSGGGSLMGAYHSQSIEPNIRPARGRTVVDAALDLPPADLFVFVAAHTGRPEVLTDWMDPSITDESDLTSVDPALDPFNPDHGPPYAPEFVERYRAGQRARNDRITAWCRAELDRLEAARPDRPPVHDVPHLGRPADDRRLARPVGPAHAVVLRRRPAAGQLRGVRSGHGQHVPQLAEHVEPHRLRLWRAPPPAPASTCRRSSSSRPPTTACSRRRRRRSSTPSPLPTSSSRRSPATTTSSSRPAPGTRSPIWSPTGSPHEREGSMSR